MTIRFSLVVLFNFALLLVACGGSSAEGASGTTPERAPAVAPIPEGYHSITPTLVVTDVRAAVAFYGNALGAEPIFAIDGPDGAPVHAEVRIGDSIVMIDREDPEHGQKAPPTLGAATGSLYVYVPDADAAIARAVGAGATPVMPATDMFWGDRYGQVRDPSGHTWALATHRTDLTAAEIRSRGEAFFGAMASGQQPPALTGGTPATSHVPQGYFTVTPSLVVRSADAVQFYVRALGATERETMLGPDGSLLHAEIQIGDSIIMLGQENLQMEAGMRAPANVGGVSLALVHYTTDADAAFARATQNGAQVAMPVTEMFWGDRFGQVTDPSGQVWGVATHVRDVSVEDMERDMQAAMGQQTQGS